MLRRVSLKEAEQFLSDVDSKNAFWVHDGPVVRNMHELQTALENMKDETFSYHVSDAKNDFASWVRNSVGDEALADKLEKAKSRGKAAKAVVGRADYLDKIVNKNRLNANKEKTFLLDADIMTEMAAFTLGLLIGILLGTIIEAKLNIMSYFF